ncbi:MAG: uncharacterized protein QG555_911 [Thermodesulfobacteriota bacterium]|nr:uncharacterized protein [Thermodesulfobacteriota bacterium]
MPFILEMVVGAGLVDLWIPACRSLKEKRSVLAKIVKRTQNTFNVSIAEVGDNDSWKQAKIGFCVVGNDRRYINAKVDHIFNYIEEMGIAQVISSHLEITSYSEWLNMQSEGADKYGDF